MLICLIGILSIILFTYARARIEKGYFKVLPLPRLCSPHLIKISMWVRHIQDTISSTTLAVSLKAFDVGKAQGVWIFGKSPAGDQSASLMLMVHPAVTESNSFFQLQVS